MAGFGFGYLLMSVVILRVLVCYVSCLGVYGFGFVLLVVLVWGAVGFVVFAIGIGVVCVFGFVCRVCAIDLFGGICGVCGDVV